MSQYNTITSSGGGGGNEFWSDAQERLEDEVAGAEGSDLESVTMESEGTSGEFEVTDLSLSDDYTSVDQAQTELANLESMEKAVLVASLVVAAGSVVVWMDGDA